MKRRKAQLDTYMHIRVPTALLALIDRCAGEHMITTSAFTRAALVTALAEYGVETPRFRSNLKRRDVITEGERREVAALSERLGP
jgi:hypothetical protein